MAPPQDSDNLGSYVDAGFDRYLQRQREDKEGGEFSRLLDGRNLLESSIRTSRLQDSSITNTKMSSDSIGTDEITDEAVTENKLADGVFIPIGGIILWSGATADIPDGWGLCDGSGDTPDLTDRFVVGAGDTYSPDDTGGSDSHTHSDGSYSVASHNHGSGSLYARIAHATGDNRIYAQRESRSWTSNVKATGLTASGATHSESQGTNVAGSTANASPGVGGTSGSADSKPKYYALCFIMRTS